MSILFCASLGVKMGPDGRVGTVRGVNFWPLELSSLPSRAPPPEVGGLKNLKHRPINRNFTP